MSLSQVLIAGQLIDMVQYDVSSFRSLSALEKGRIFDFFTFEGLCSQTARNKK